MLRLEEAETLAAELGPDVAFLRAEQGIYFARGTPSPVLALLRGIHELEPERARWIVRGLVWSTREATATCAGATRVAGKRLRAPVTPRDHGLKVEGPRIDAGAAVPAPRRAAAALEAALRSRVEGAGRRDLAGLARLTLDLAASVARAPVEGRADRPIAALLASASGDVLEWATNTGGRNPTSHAELNLVGLAHARGLWTPGTVVVSSLQPCKMCAGLLWDRAPDRAALRVFYAEPDTGSAARETVLEPGTMARKRFAAGAELLLASLQRVEPSTGIPRA